MELSPMSDPHPNSDIQQSGIFETPPEVAAKAIAALEAVGVTLPTVTVRRSRLPLPTAVRRFDYNGWNRLCGGPVFRFFRDAPRRHGNYHDAGRLTACSCVSIHQIAFRGEGCILGGGSVLIEKNGHTHWELPVDRLVKCFDADGLFEQATRLTNPIQVQCEDAISVTLDTCNPGPVTVTCYVTGEQWTPIDRC